MELARTEYYEVAAAVVYGALFAFWEWRRPVHDVSRTREWQRDALAFGMLVIGLFVSRHAVHAVVNAGGLDAWLAAQKWREWPKPVQILLAGLMIDFSLYWVHRLMHTRALWNAHKWHHSVEEMYWVSGMRTSLVHAFLFAVPQVLVGFYVFPFTIADIGMASASGVFMQFFVHANVRLPLGPLEYIFVTPQSHRRHHALIDGVAHGNYATTYSFWDRMFGTYVDYKSLPKNYPLGIGERGDTGRMVIGV